MNAELVFALLLAGIIYCYFGYPAILTLIASIRRPRLPREEHFPHVTLLIVAYNEEKVIAAKIRNSLSLDYPDERLEIVVASDASTDKTDSIVRQFASEGIRLIRRPTRGSQTGAQNYAVPRSGGEIIVFSDANSMYRPDAIRKLVAPFADPRVGAVIGRLTHSNPDTTAVSFGEELYWRYEAFLKRIQSAASALFLANGAIYAVRRDRYRPVHPGHDHDTIVPLRVAREGYRVVYEPAALAVETASERFGDEFRRKVRIIVRDAWTFIDLRFLLSPFRPWLAFNIISHKVMRWAIGFALAGIWVSNLFLLDHSFYRWTMTLQVFFYGAALLARPLDRLGVRSVLTRVPFYFCLVNGAGVAAAFALLARKRMREWQPRSW